VDEGPRPSDAAPAIAALGTGDVAGSVVSLSQRHADGRDAEYLEWHLLDHLPEQHRLAGLRSGQRWVSTPACRAARAASAPPFDAVDHVVQYLFAEPLGPALDHFFGLGRALHGLDRMPIALPRVQVGGWKLAAVRAADRVLVGAAVLPWRPARGAYLLVEPLVEGMGGAADLASLVAVAGVAGAWRWTGAALDERLDATDGLALTVCYLDDDPVAVAARLAPVEGALLAAPFEAVVAGAWDRHLP
jgi:hypothetical protein